MALTSSALMKSMRVKFTNQPIFTILLLAQILILVNSILRVNDTEYYARS